MKRALVLAGDGVAGIAWELGVLRGLQDTDPDLANDPVSSSLMLKLINRVKSSAKPSLGAALARPGAGSGLASRRVFLR